MVLISRRSRILRPSIGETRAVTKRSREGGTEGGRQRAEGRRRKTRTAQFVILSLPLRLRSGQAPPLSERSERGAAQDGEGSPVAAPGAGAKLWFEEDQRQTPSALLPHAAHLEILRRPPPHFARYARSAAPDDNCSVVGPNSFTTSQDDNWAVGQQRFFTTSHDDSEVELSAASSTPDFYADRTKNQKIPSAFRLLPSAFRLLPSPLRLLPSAFSLPPSAFCLLPSAFRLLPSAFNSPSPPRT